jgi:hypothetical protein
VKLVDRQRRAVRAIACAATIALALLPPTSVLAQQPTCKLQSIEKKIAAQALTSFMQKCENEAEGTCENQAVIRKLEEPARSLFIRACLRALVG